VEEKFRTIVLNHSLVDFIEIEFPDDSQSHSLKIYAGKREPVVHY
jgi:hypothetical protein